MEASAGSAADDRPAVPGSEEQDEQFEERSGN
jgi:hypothetical protein